MFAIGQQFVRAECATGKDHAKCAEDLAITDKPGTGALGGRTVAAHDVGALHQHLAGGPRGQMGSVRVGDRYALPGERQSYGTRFAQTVDRIERRAANTLRQPVALDQRKAIARFESIEKFRRRERRAAHAKAQTRRVGPHSGRQGVEHGVDRRHRGEVRRSQLLDVEAPTDGDAPAARQWHQGAHHDTVDVEQRRHQHAVVGGSDLQRLAPHVRHGLDVSVVQHHALGQADHATGVDQQRQCGRVSTSTRA